MADLDTTGLRKAYWDHIRGLAEEAQTQIAETPGADEYDILHDIVDSSEWVIYTGKAILALYLSDQAADLYIEEFGDVPTEGSDPCVLCHKNKRVDSMNWSALAVTVIQADVQEQLSANKASA